MKESYLCPKQILLDAKMTKAMSAYCSIRATKVILADEAD